MPRIRSLVERAQVDEAGRAHNCQANSRHRILKGDKRLKVRNGRSWDHYCVECGRTIVGRDIKKLEALFGELGPVKEEAGTSA
jgi:hypothetical protein